MNIIVRTENGRDRRLLEEYCRKQLGKELIEKLQQTADLFVNRAMEQALAWKELRRGIK